jgi:hypothetical protein
LTAESSAKFGDMPEGLIAVCESFAAASGGLARRTGGAYLLWSSYVDRISREIPRGRTACAAEAAQAGDCDFSAYTDKIAVSHFRQHNVSKTPCHNEAGVENRSYPTRPAMVTIEPMKFAQSRPFADPEAAARKLMEIANSVESVQDEPHAYREDQ